MPTVIINMGTNVQGDGTAPDAVAAALAKEAGIPSAKRVSGPDDLGYFEYVFTTPAGRDVGVCIPSIPLERFHEPAPPRVYVDGSSWMWKFAVEWLRDWDALQEEGD